MVKSNAPSSKFMDCCGVFLLFMIGIFIKLPPNNAAGRVVRIIGIVALEFKDVNES